MKKAKSVITNLIILAIVVFLVDVGIKAVAKNEMMTEKVDVITDLETFEQNYFTHYYVLNENQVLVYIPEKVEYEGQVFYNEKTGFYIISVNLFAYQFDKANSIDLIKIFWL